MPDGAFAQIAHGMPARRPKRRRGSYSSAFRTRRSGNASRLSAESTGKCAKLDKRAYVRVRALSATLSMPSAPVRSDRWLTLASALN
jgi:hypothetical protein